MPDVIRSAVSGVVAAEHADLLGADLFRLRRVGHTAWPTLNQDVRAWLDGEPIDTFLRPGKSRDALLRRFDNYARERGWKVPYRERARTRKTNVEMLAAWLESGWPTPKNKEIAEAYISTASMDEAGQRCGVSHQRVHQVLMIARKQMAEQMNDFPEPRVAQINWNAFADGKVWRLSKGVDFGRSIPSAINAARAWATKNDFLVSIQRDRITNDAIYVRFNRKEVAA